MMNIWAIISKITFLTIVTLSTLVSIYFSFISAQKSYVHQENNCFTELLTVKNDYDMCFKHPNSTFYYYLDYENVDSVLNKKLRHFNREFSKHGNMKLVKLLDEIKNKRQSVMDYIKLHSSEELRKIIYYIVIYNIVSIGGNALSLEDVKYVLQTKLAVGNKKLKDHNQVMGVDLAFRYIKHIVTMDEITTEDILNIHRCIDPLNCEHFKTEFDDNNSFLESVFEFVYWLNSKKYQDMHPVVFASYAHLKLMTIRIFGRGNGVLGMVLMNLILVRKGYPLIIIDKNKDLSYHESVKLAFTGNTDPFLQFIACAMNETMNFYMNLKSITM